tara:strand:- start:2913 stop:3494 length:582 start_codon:yes stop_codon:yes gene_type:complete
MKETLLIITLIILIYIFLFYNNNKLVYIENSNFGTRFLVQNNKDKFKSSKILSELTKKLYILRNYLVNNINKFPKFKQYIILLENGFNNNRTTIHEGLSDSNLTSYSVNKGEELIFCLKSKKTDEYHKMNILMYVAIHELAHVACPEIGHGTLFIKIFKFLAEQAVKLKLYKYKDYYSNPEEYCGMILSSTVL